MSLPNPVEALLWYALLYPVAVTWLWMAGAVFYWLRHERAGGSPGQAPRLERYPTVAVIVPCYNEAAGVDEAIGQLMRLEYPGLEVIAVDDGSVDGTAERLARLSRRHPRLRVVRLLTNQGRATALNTAAMMTRAEILVTIDGDALLDRWAIHWLVGHFRWPRVAAVTGNPRVRACPTLLGRLQVGEYSSSAGLIRRAQRTYGRMFTVSGVVSAFRRSALHDVGYWSTDVLAEDVDICWKLQTRHWDVRFEPNALCWVRMPQTLGELWRQRVRWAAGGFEVLAKNCKTLRAWRKRRMWPVFAGHLLGAIWACAVAGLASAWAVSSYFGVDPGFAAPGSGLALALTAIAVTALVQLLLGLAIDSRLERGMWRPALLTPWYPLAFWVLHLFSSVAGLPKAFLRPAGQRPGWRRWQGEPGMEERAWRADGQGGHGDVDRVASVLLAGSFWLGWLALWAPLLSLFVPALSFAPALGEAPGPGAANPAVTLVGGFSATVAVLMASLIGWAWYNIIRFRGIERRKASASVQVAQVADRIGVDSEILEEWLHARLLRVAYDEEGLIESVEAFAGLQRVGDPVAEPATPGAPGSRALF
jgi:poly-beta-1,6-N-acetyl-D-glucosamine synthase